MPSIPRAWSPSPTGTEPPAAIETDGLTKVFRGGQVAVDAIDLRVPLGAVYGFLGPNGSGKTTTIRMLLGLVRPTSGRSRLLGAQLPEDAEQVLPRVGALIEGPAFHPYLSARANLHRLDAADRTTSARTSAVRIDSALERVGLSGAAGKRYRTFSLGMRQRLGIAAALLRPRDLLVLDEPTNGLDPQGTREVRALVRRLGDEGVTVLVSSHLLAEVEQMCSHVGVMSAGSLVWQGSLADLGREQGARVHVGTPDTARAAEVLTRSGLPDVRIGHQLVTAVLGGTTPESLVADLVAHGVGVREFRVENPGLEDMFVRLTGEGFDVPS